MDIIINIAKQIAIKLNINDNELINIIKDKYSKLEFNKNIDTKLIDKINKLLKNDEELNQFEKQLDSNTIPNFKILKTNLGKLQLLILLKNLEKCESNTDILNTFISIVDKKISNINELLIEQIGGNNNPKYTENNYYELYIKYKYRYIKLKYSNLALKIYN